MVIQQINTRRLRPGAPAGEQAKVEAQLKPLQLLNATYQAFELAEKRLVSEIGVPICMARCGKCCEVTSVTVWEVEAQFIYSWLLGQQPERINHYLSICEGWLLERHSSCTTYGVQPGKLNADQAKKLMPEIDGLLRNSPCPMLTAEKQCAIHDARPLVCRAYGVTRMPGLICKRPLARMECPDVRAHISQYLPVGMRLKEMVDRTLAAARKNGWGNSRFLATAIFAAMKPKVFNEYVYDGRIACAKLAVTDNDFAILFQSQLNQVWATEIKNGDNALDPRAS